MLEIDKLLVEHDGDTSCGENLEYDNLLLEVREAIEGKPEQKLGDGIIEGEEPDWKLVKKNCIDLCGKTHNIEVVVSLTRALMHLEGFSGMVDGSALLAGTIEKYWGCVHPQIDPDDNDPIERLNMLAIFEDFNFLLFLQRIELISSKGVGKVSLYDIRQSKFPKEDGSDDTAIDSKLIEAIFKSSSEDHKKSIYAWLGQCITNFEKISSLLREQENVGSLNAPAFPELLKIINEAKTVVGAYLGHTDNVESEEGSSINTDTDMGIQNTQVSKGINTRADVTLAIQEIEDYYYKNEPGSPIPLLLKRAKKLVDKDFISLMENLAPDSLQQVELVLGSKPE